MSNINLLPWREELQAQRSKRLMFGTVVLWLATAGVIFGVYTYVEDLKNAQKARNGFLNTEIAALEDEIREIEDLRDQRDDLISRMRVIQGLQQNRTQLVQILDDLVRLLPDGVYFTQLDLRGDKITLRGRAQSNARVSNLMRAFESSEWFHGPNLEIIKVVETNEGRISDFTLNIAKVGRVKEKKPG